MPIHMKNLERLSLAEMQEFVQGSRKLTLSLEGQAAIYGFIEALLKAQQYRRLSRGQRGVVRRFLTKVSGLSRAQITRVLFRSMRTRQVRRRPPQRPNFPRRYSSGDVVLPAEADAAHEELSGPATRYILEREFSVFGKAEYEKLSGISVSTSTTCAVPRPIYLRYRVRVQHTQRSQVSIAERRKPDPQGKPGYLRVDTVHQGQHDGQPGLYHLNAVDTVTQWEIVGCVETISERHLLPVLEAMLHQFPFRILGFHCDNGSEFINHQVAALLNQLLVEFTKSRAYRTTDNALVEGKNGAVVRKHIGYGRMGAPHAEELQKFFTAHFTPSLNYHRPCGFAVSELGAGGKKKRIYRTEDYQTPYEKLTSLPDWRQYLKAGLRPAALQQQAGQMSDTEAARRMKKAKLAVLQKCREKP